MLAVTCSTCGRNLKVTNEAAGRKVRCPCGTAVVVPAARSQTFPSAEKKRRNPALLAVGYTVVLLVLLGGFGLFLWMKGNRDKARQDYAEASSTQPDQPVATQAATQTEPKPEPKAEPSEPKAEPKPEPKSDPKPDKKESPTAEKPAERDLEKGVSSEEIDKLLKEQGFEVVDDGASYTITFEGRSYGYFKPKCQNPKTKVAIKYLQGGRGAHYRLSVSHDAPQLEALISLTDKISTTFGKVTKDALDDYKKTSKESVKEVGKLRVRVNKLGMSIETIPPPPVSFTDEP